MSILRTTYYVASTVDGFIADADGGVGYLSKLGEPDPEPYQAFIETIDGLLMGRVTYDQILGFGEWPYGDLPCWVATSRSLDHVVGNTKPICGDPQELLDQIGTGGTEHLWLVGGGKLAAQFANAFLIDDLIVSIIPIALGGGIRLFDGMKKETWFTHRKTETRSGGILEIHYSKRKPQSD